MKTSNGVGQINPKIAWITVNRNCNMRCKWCYAAGTNYQGEMSLEFAKELALFIHDYGIKKVIIIGGEPTIWESLPDLNRFCRELGLETTLATNAVRFSDKTFWERYEKNPNDSIGISLKGCDSFSYEETAGVTNFSSMVSGLKKSLELFECGVGTVYSSLNPKELIDTAEFSRGIGASFLNIGFCTPTVTKEGSDGRFMTPPDQVVRNVLEVYDEINSIMEGRISFSMKLPLCLWPESFLETLISRRQITTQCQLRQRSGLIFDVNGDVLMCNSLPDHPIGKFGEDFSTVEEFEQFLRSPTIVNYYDRINNYPSEKCITCEKYPVCGGGCPLLWSVYEANDIITGF
jgi:radical SAM protein with 4Fe4S-binding SPASM domain